MQYGGAETITQLFNYPIEREANVNGRKGLLNLILSIYIPSQAVPWFVLFYLYINLSFKYVIAVDTAYCSSYIQASPQIFARGTLGDFNPTLYLLLQYILL